MIGHENRTSECVHLFATPAPLDTAIIHIRHVVVNYTSALTCVTGCLDELDGTRQCLMNHMSMTSIPLQVNELPGGVARNISDACIRILPAKDIELVTIVGTDAAASTLLDHWRQRGASTAGIRIQAMARTATVALAMQDGEIAAGVADTGIVEDKLHSVWISERLQANPQCRYVLLEANLHPETLCIVARECWQKDLIVLVDPVSVTKALRWASPRLLHRQL